MQFAEIYEYFQVSLIYPNIACFQYKYYTFRLIQVLPVFICAQTTYSDLYRYCPFIFHLHLQVLHAFICISIIYFYLLKYYLF